jgi:hypothetical protein
MERLIILETSIKKAFILVNFSMDLWMEMENNSNKLYKKIQIYLIKIVKLI